MIFIKRSNVPSVINEELLKKKKSPEWRRIDKTDHSRIRKEFDSLLCKQQIRDWLGKDQHYLCAYCMKRIDPTDVLRVKIEHFIPVTESKDDVFNANNYFLVCHGGSKSDSVKKILCCDSSKLEKECILRPDDQIKVQKILYSKSGIISYRDTNNSEEEEKINHEINYIFNLNGEWCNETNSSIADTSTELIKGRRDAYKSACRIISNLDKKNKLTKANLEKEIIKLMSSEKYIEFVGVIVFFLKRKIRTISSV